MFLGLTPLNPKADTGQYTLHRSSTRLLLTDQLQRLHFSLSVSDPVHRGQGRQVAIRSTHLSMSLKLLQLAAQARLHSCCHLHFMLKTLLLEIT